MNGEITKYNNSNSNKNNEASDCIKLFFILYCF